MGSTWINAASAAYPAMARLYDAHESVKDNANQGYYVISGCDVIASPTAGKLKVNTGTIFSGTTEVLVGTAIDTIACCANADATFDRWAILEIDNTTTPGTPTATLNLGTAAATPIMPTLTAGRSAHAFIYIPANATTVDALNSTNNGKAKIIDARQLRSVPISRRLGYDVSGTVLTYAVAGSLASFTSSLSTLPTIPANSVNIGDVIEIEASFRYINNVTASTLQVKFIIGSVIIATYTTPSLSINAFGRAISFKAKYIMKTTGSNATAYIVSDIATSIASSSFVATTGPTGGAAGGDYGTGSGTIVIDTTTSATIDLQSLVTAASVGATLSMRYFSVRKTPA